MYSDNPSKIPVYSPALFVGREELIQRIQEIMDKIHKGASDRNPVRSILVKGERGSGKTWLSLHLQRKVLPDLPWVKSLLIRLSPNLDERRRNIESEKGEKEIDTRSRGIQGLTPEEGHLLCSDILEWIAAQLEVPVIKGGALKDLSSWIQRKIETMVQERRVFVLVLDSLFEADWNFLDTFENYLLAPLANIPNTLLIMTGRGKIYPWVSPSLKMDRHEEVLLPFSKSEVEQQLSKEPGQPVLSAEEIFRLGKGYPLTNILLAHETDRVKALNTVADILLSVIEPDRRPLLRVWLEALCVLDGFRDEEVAPMLSAYHNKPDEEGPDLIEVRKEREYLVSMRIVRWENGKFIIDETIRFLLESYLFEKRPSPQEWVRQQKKAYQLYKQWGKEFSKHYGYYEQKAEFHSKALQDRGISL